MKWNLLSSAQPKTLEELRQVLLKNRGVTDESEFFSPKSPLEMSLEEVGLDSEQMSAAVARIHQAKENQEDVLIFGDYDADGVSSTATLWQALKSIGIIARPFIPDRHKHGYGLSLRSLEAVLADKKPDLLITVDNGVVAHQAFAKLRELHIDTILTDHHQPELDKETGKAVFPLANIIVHSTQLCGTTVAWFFARALNPEAAEKSLDLAAIATIADQMPLLGANRAFVKHGLQALKKTQRVGLRLLMAKANIEQKNVDVTSINYGIAPRINAMGRLKHGMDALRLLCTTSMERADELVNELNDTNISRQELTSDLIAQALERAAEWKDEHIIIIESPDFHEGVIGLIAGKLMEQFYKPAIVISMGEKIAKASARSVSGVNIIELIRLVREDLLEAGGHTLAAGFAFEPEKLEVVRQRLQKLAKEKITAESLVPSVDIECILPHELVTMECAECLTDLGPFGQGNREPVFGLEGLRAIDATAMGKEGKHLRASFLTKNNVGISGIAWSKGAQAKQLLSQVIRNVAGSLQVNEWQNRKSLQIMIRDL
jgi:single-stranded-DNA-specific exonuclease